MTSRRQGRYPKGVGDTSPPTLLRGTHTYRTYRRRFTEGGTNRGPDCRGSRIDFSVFTRTLKRHSPSWFCLGYETRRMTTVHSHLPRATDPLLLFALPLSVTPISYLVSKPRLRFEECTRDEGPFSRNRRVRKHFPD